ncbi:MAG: mechanosensitive ion channel [Betaproteobacteria bacterium]|nr:MAG: mechanosensitive ion channel [Betaproteobacteria bacterium]
MISTGLRYLRSFTGALLLLLALGVAPVYVAAQEPEKAVAQEAKTTAQEGEEAKAEDASQSEKDQEKAEPEPITEAQRLKRLERVIKLDQDKLAETKKQLAEQEAFFDALNTSVEQAVPKLEEKKKQLEEMGGAEASDESAALAKEVQGLEEQIKVGKAELEVRFNTVKTLKGQIQALEKKIATDQQALQTLISPTTLPAPATPAPPVSDAPSPPPAEQPAPSPAQVIVPGAVPSQPAATQQPKEAKPETAEQIEARREAEKREQEAKLAERELVTFVERKRQLEQQIEMEQTLLETAETSRDNLDRALNMARSELDTLIEQGAGKAKMREVKQRIDNIRELVQQNHADIDQRRDYIESLYQRHKELSAEQLAVTQQLKQKIEEAGAARKRSVWLQSPLHPRNLLRWFVERGPRILIVIVAAWILLFLVRVFSRRIARALLMKGESERRGGAKRADTLALSFQSAASVVIIIGAGLLAFQEAGVDIKTVLGGAAILGVAFAFGAQNLMRDYFTGIMIILEDQYELGDLITIGAVTGTVEKVNMRTTVLRDFEGRVHFIPNGEIKSVTNRTYVWGRALLRIPVALKEDPDHVIRVLREVEEEFRADPEVGEWVTDDPVVLGVDKFSEYGMVILTYMKTRPDTVFQTRRELLRRIKKRFDEEGIEISVPNIRLLQGEDAEGTPEKTGQ